MTRRAPLDRVVPIAGLCLAFCVIGCVRPAGPPADAILNAADHHNNLGVALMDHGHYEEAVEEFRAALREWDGHVEARVNLGISLYYDHQPEEARALFETVLSHRPDHTRARYMMGLLATFHVARPEEAVSHFAAVVAADPGDPWARFYHGLALGRSRRAGEAVAALEAAVELSPGHQAALYQLSLSLRGAGRTGDADAALARFKRLREEFPGSSTPGVGYMEQGRHAEALAVSSVPRRPLRFERGGPAERAVEGARALSADAWTLDGDIDNDGVEERFEISPGHLALRGAADGGGWTDRTAAAELTESGIGVTGGALADVDHDGDIDLYLTTGGASDRLYLNDGSGRFHEHGTEAGLAGDTERSTGVVFADFDDDRAIDFIVAREGAPPRLYINNRDGSFTDWAQEAGLGDADASRGVSAGDVDQDGRLDLLFTPAGTGPPDLRLGARGRGYRRSPEPVTLEPLREDSRCALYDTDRDGDLDVICSDGSHFLNAMIDSVEEPVTMKVTPRGLIRPQVLSNFSGIGAKVEIRSPGLWLRRDVRAGTSEILETGFTFGLGRVTRLDYVRTLFPSGVRLTKRDTDAGEPLTIEEPAGKFTSCPMIYTWDGDGFRFINDTLGFAVLGEWEPPGRWMRPDPDEWVAIDGDDLVPEGGALRVRFVDQLEEIAFLDTVRLVAVDHSADVEVHPAEPNRDAGQSELPPPIHIVTATRPLHGARDSGGRDVGALLRDADGRHVSGFALLPWRGLAEPHDLILELGPLEGERPLLLMTGWTDWGSSSSLRGASQAGITPIPISLAIPDGEGWRVVRKDIGMPAGLPRTIVVPLAGLPLTGENPRIRIRTNLIVYWDRIAIGFAAPATDTRLTALPLTAADLRRLGYPQRVVPADEEAAPDDPSVPPVYDYHHRRDDAEWERFTGAFTRFGNVLPLLARRDDRLVIMNHGDEIALTFDGSRLPPPPRGRRRDYLFFAGGYGKDMDINSAAPGAIAPHPWHEMPDYPPPPAAPGPDRIDHHLEFNTRAAGSR